ncbi:Cell-division-associated, ABC-transporter-like signaling protein FtsX [hydrothermal vent metagenome]|uniref:Cell-division-associated, ABC-transporter-like signaling protein FtsX n=1 Tax=hydrothermal vent metagenome TaxID=652676 RepID=A0A3B0TB00_9ZZZZ
MADTDDFAAGPPPHHGRRRQPRRVEPGHAPVRPAPAPSPQKPAPAQAQPTAPASDQLALPGPSTGEAAPRIRRDIAPKPSPVIPTDGIAGRPLFIVVTVMCYLASVTLGASLLISSQISDWTSDIAQEITIQIRPVDGISIDTQVITAVQLLAATPGVRGADPISLNEAAALLEPWLGSGNVLDDLPIPRLIAVEIDTDNPPDLDALAGRLDSEVEGASLNDHRRWQSGLRRMAASLQTIAWAVIILVSGTTLSIIVFATRAAMAGNREIIEVLHLVGATENFIAYQIQKRFFILGLVSGLIGVAFAILTFLTLNSLSGAVAAGSFTGAATSLMFGPLSLDLSSYLFFFLIPITAAVIGVITSRIIVIGVVRAMH